jgi:putative hydrolase of the HAD superfamily
MTIQKPDGHRDRPPLSVPGITDEMARRYLRPLQPQPVESGFPRGSLLTARCFLFDIYGTLLISACGDIGLAGGSVNPVHRLARLLERYGIEADAARVREGFAGEVAACHAMMKQKGIGYPEIVVEEIWQAALKIENVDTARRFALEFELLTNPVWPMPGMVELLEAIRHAGVPMGIVSNAQFYTPLLFEWFCGKDLLALGFDPDLMVFSYRIGQAKPSRYLFTTVRERLEQRGIDPAGTLYLGNDMVKDILPAGRGRFPHRPVRRRRPLPAPPRRPGRSAAPYPPGCGDSRNLSELLACIPKR